MNGVIISGAVGSGKTTKALELVDDYIIYDEHTSYGDLLTNKTIIVDDADLLKKDVLKKIIKTVKGNLILTVTDLNALDKGTKENFKKINTGKIDKRKEEIRKKYPHSSQSGNYNNNIFKVLENIYNNSDRNFVNEMLNDIKPNIYSLMIFMLENGNLDLLQYIDREQLFKSKLQFLYSTLAYGIEPKSRRIQWPRKSPSEKIDDELKRHFKLRASDMQILKDVLKISKIEKPKTKKIKPIKFIEKNTNELLMNTNSVIINNQSIFDKW